MKKEFKKKDCKLNGHNVFELRSVKEIVDMYNDNMHESIIKQSIVRFLSKFISNRGVQIFKHNELPIIEYNCNITLNNQQTSKISKITFKYKVLNSKHNIVFDKKLLKTSAPVLIDNVEVGKINLELFSTIFTDCFSIETEDPSLLPLLIAIVVAFDNIRDNQARDI